LWRITQRAAAQAPAITRPDILSVVRRRLWIALGLSGLTHLASLPT
jgi:hypothetical protein